MPLGWKPWLISLLTANMIAPLFMLSHVEARVVFAVALLNGALFSVLTAATGFSRLLGLAHLPWIPLVWYLVETLSQSDTTPVTTWKWAVILLNSGSLVLDAVNVIRYIGGERGEMVDNL